MTETREIHLGVDLAADGSAYRISAECDDELTEMIVVNPGDLRAVLVPDQAALSGEYGRMLVEDHRGRCSACQAWAALPARVTT